MSTTGSVQLITPSQMKELCSASQQAAPVADADSPSLAKIITDCQRALRCKLPRKYAVVDPLPAGVTEEVVARLARYNMRPVFLPGLEIAENLKLRNWVMPPPRFFQWVRDGRIAKDSATLRRGWYAADFSVGVDCADGTQVFPNDPWAPLIQRLRQQSDDLVGKFDKTPEGSRFAITHDEWIQVVLGFMATELGFPRANLERASELNAIGNLYDPNRGAHNMWIWLADPFEDSARLVGGDRVHGGLASVHYGWHDDRSRRIASRPLVVL